MLFEKLNIVKKNWNINIPNFKVITNDTKDHSLLDRIDTRTNLGYNKINTLLQKGTEYLVSKLDMFETDYGFVTLTYTKSKIKVIFFINIKKSIIKIKTIMPLDFKTNTDFYWDISENRDVIDVPFKNFDFYSESGVSVETNLTENSKDVYPVEITELDINL